MREQGGSAGGLNRTQVVTHNHEPVTCHAAGSRKAGRSPNPHTLIG